MLLGVLLACGLGGVGLAVLNVATTRRLWASQIFERPQKIAQSVLMWIVPGSVFLVRAVLGERHEGRAIDASDPTAFSSSRSDDYDSAYGSVGSHHFGSGHGGGGFGDGGGGDGSVGGA
jgi:hypothetical protein